MASTPKARIPGTALSLAPERTKIAATIASEISVPKTPTAIGRLKRSRSSPACTSASSMPNFSTMRSPCRGPSSRIADGGDDPDDHGYRAQDPHRDEPDVPAGARVEPEVLVVLPHEEIGPARHQPADRSTERAVHRVRRERPDDEPEDRHADAGEVEND